MAALVFCPHYGQMHHTYFLFLFAQVHVFDLAVDKYAPLCSQHVSRKGKLTRIAFKSLDPVIIVGDDRGSVTSFKLSPNLRKILKVLPGFSDHDFADANTFRQQKKQTDEQQVEAMDKVLESVLESAAPASA